MTDTELLRQTFEQIVTAMHPSQVPDDWIPPPLAKAILHSDARKPVAIILVIDDPDVASKFAAMLPQLESRLGVVCDANGST